LRFGPESFDLFFDFLDGDIGCPEKLVGLEADPQSLLFAI
jgi:hypothetical protein